MRKLFGLLALPAVLCAFSISASGAAASQQQCFNLDAYQPVCAWSGSEWNGTFSWWPGSSTGCHNHTGNPNLRSFWNNSPYTIRMGGWGTLPSGYGYQIPGSGSVTGDICWPA
jgi:Peptidase inhibitor family I36